MRLEVPKKLLYRVAFRNQGYGFIGAKSARTASRPHQPHRIPPGNNSLAVVHISRGMGINLVALHTDCVAHCRAGHRDILQIENTFNLPILFHSQREIFTACIDCS